MQKKYLETKTTARLDFVGSLFGEGLHNLSHNKVCFVSYVGLAFILFSYQIFHLISCANIFSLLLPLYVIDLVINRTDNADINCTLTPADTTDTDITYEIADNSIAKLNGSKVVAVGNGTTTLTAACGKIKANAQITVTTAPTEIQLDSTEGVLTVGNTHTIQTTLLPETTTDTDLAWSVNDESIATVDENGTVTAQSPGNCVVTAATPDGALKATYSLTVKAKQTVKAASNTSTTTPSYTAPSAPSASTPTYVPAPAPAPDPAPAPAPAEPSQPSGGSSPDYSGSSGFDANLGSWSEGSGIDWTQDNSNGSKDDGIGTDIFD